MPDSSPSAGRLTTVTSTGPQQLEKASGTTRRLLALVVGFVLAMLGLTATAGPAAAQNVVEAQPIMSILTVGPHGIAGQENIGVRGSPLRQIVLTTGVAAEGGSMFSSGTAVSNAGVVESGARRFTSCREGVGRARRGRPGPSMNAGSQTSKACESVTRPFWAVCRTSGTCPIWAVGNGSPRPYVAQRYSLLGSLVGPGSRARS